MGSGRVGAPIDWQSGGRKAYEEEWNTAFGERATGTTIRQEPARTEEKVVPLKTEQRPSTTVSMASQQGVRPQTMSSHNLVGDVVPLAAFDRVFSSQLTGWRFVKRLGLVAGLTGLMNALSAGVRYVLSGGEFSQRESTVEVVEVGKSPAVEARAMLLEFRRRKKESTLWRRPKRKGD